MKTKVWFKVSGWTIFIISIGLGLFISPWWFVLAAFVGCYLSEPCGSDCCTFCFRDKSGTA